MKGYCHWCDTSTNLIIKLLDKGRLVWVGCTSCYEKRNNRTDTARPEPTRLTEVGKDEE